MNFIPASELKKTYEVFGHFYNLKLSDTILECRSVLNIKRKGKASETPDIVIIMMNPGSSMPLDQLYKPKSFSKNEYFNINKKEIVPAKPDNAQYQIMRLMELNNWDFVRILNLSDLRNGNSREFQIDLRKARDIDDSNPHCLTHIERKKELDSSIESKSNKVIAAWGSISELNTSANLFLDMCKIKGKSIIGLKMGNTSNYRHASPLLKEQKVSWLEEIQRLLDR